MSRPCQEQDLLPGHRIVLESSVLVSYLDGGEAVSPVAACVVDELVQSGRNPASLCALTVAELLVRAFRAGQGAERDLLDFLHHFPNLAIERVSERVAIEAARLRAMTGMKTPDAAIVATGVTAGARCAVTNGANWSARLAPVRRSTLLRAMLVYAEAGSLDAAALAIAQSGDGWTVAEARALLAT